MKKNILLLGGTGAMGLHLTSILQNSNYNVYITSRSNRKNKDNIKFIKGNAHDEIFLKSILKQKDWEIIIDFMIYNTTEFTKKIDLLLNSCKQYVFLSSARVYADSKCKLTENSPRLLDVSTDREYLQTDEYALSKAREENILLKSANKNWTIIRPYITYSEIRLQLGVLEKEYWLYQALHNRTIVFSKDIANKRTTLTYGYDVARGIASILGNKEAFSEIFHITVEENYTWQEIFDIYIRVLEEELGFKPKIKIIDENPHTKIKGHGWQIKYDRYYNRTFNNNKIGKYIDIKSFKPTLEGLKQCLIDFIHNPSFRITGWNDFAMYDRITGEWTPLSEIPTLKNKIKYLLRRTIMPLK